MLFFGAAMVGFGQRGTLGMPLSMTPLHCRSAPDLLN